MEVAKKIDVLLEQDWRTEDLRPAEPATDEEFLRRANLDLIGRIPTVAEARKFLSQPAAQRREILITELLQSRRHEEHMARSWRRIWMPRSENPEFRRRAQAFDYWLATEMAEGQQYDHIVQRLMTASPVPSAGKVDLKSENLTPALFLATSDFEPEQLAANSMRAFLGLNLDCAQCHNHPFARWKQTQFWETAAFFARPSGEENARSEYFLKIPGTEETVVPQFLNGKSPSWPEEVDHRTGRELLARWLASPENPFFAQNAVNRFWAIFFGAGLVEPLDDLSQPEFARHAEVLQVLSDAFISSHFDFRYLTEVIVRTHWYQSTSRTREGMVTMPLRVLAGEQLYESLQVAAGFPADRFDLEDSAENWSHREAFVAQFPNVDAGGQAERSRKQALALMNGMLTEQATWQTSSPFLQGLQAPFFDDESRIEALFLSSFSRFPTAAERDSCLKFLASSENPDAISNLFWALLNSSEFNTNH